MEGGFAQLARHTIGIGNDYRYTLTQTERPPLLLEGSPFHVENLVRAETTMAPQGTAPRLFSFRWIQHTAAPQGSRC
jgi:phytoene dehydrogenase-like protein